MKYIIPVLVTSVLFCLICGCSTTREFQASEKKVTIMDFDAKRRGAYILPGTDGGRFVLVSEPAPDVASEITASLGLNADTIGDLTNVELKAEYAGKIIDLASRSQTLQVLRESLFRLSEMGASSDINSQQRVDLYLKVLDTVRLIAMTEFADSDASQDVKDATLKSFLSDTATGTVDIPSQTQ